MSRRGHVPEREKLSGTVGTSGGNIPNILSKDCTDFGVDTAVDFTSAAILPNVQRERLEYVARWRRWRRADKVAEMRLLCARLAGDGHHFDSACRASIRNGFNRRPSSNGWLILAVARFMACLVASETKVLMFLALWLPTL